uniref:Calcipressin n=2 Tax=Ascaris TaxID=6251 RepID=A0A0M3HQL1_ASCLU
MHAEVLEEKLNEVRNEADLPNAIIVTNVPSEVFSDDEQKSNFSSLFTQIEANAHFDFLRSFHRVRIIFSTPENATAAKLITQHLSFNGTLLKAFFAQRVRLRDESDDGLLKLPPLEKQFLISPPASPPVGWEQCHEMAPVVCSFDLMARLAAFTVEDTYEVFGGDDDKPKIVIHPASEADEEVMPSQSSMPRTPRPPTTPRPTHKNFV